MIALVLFLNFVLLKTSSFLTSQQPLVNLCAEDHVESVQMNEIIDTYVPTTTSSAGGLNDEMLFHKLDAGACITGGLSLLLIMSLAIDHSLTDAAI